MHGEVNTFLCSGYDNKFTLTSCIRGYKDIGNPVGETVECEHEARNPQDPYAVGIRKNNVTTVAMFLAYTESIHVCVTLLGKPSLFF